MQPIIQHLFQASRLEDVSRQRLETFVAEYPSFGIGHYLLSRKLRAEGAGTFLEETQKTNLYFSNPFWLQWLLENETGGTAVAAERPVAPIVTGEPSPVQEAIVTQEPIAAESGVVVTAPDIVATGPAMTKDTMETVVEEALFAEPEIKTPLPAEPQSSSPALQEVHTADLPEAHNVDLPEAPTAEEHASPLSMVALAEEVAAAEEPKTAEPTAAEQLLQSIQEAKGLRESLQKINEAPIVEETQKEEESPIMEKSPKAEESPIKDEEAPFILDEEEKPAAHAAAAEMPESSVPETIQPVPAPAEASHPLSAPAEAAQPVVAQAPPSPPPAVAQVLQRAAAEAAAPVAVQEQSMLFEPYHTIDYFASQGIKLTLEENPSDQLGKQLKSFTDWLKVMRRIPQKEREIVPDRVAEESVQSSAAHSVVGREVVTETMAEVLAKQGMPERARAVYEKLSLQNPDKRAYFAAKIEQLNSL